MRDLHVVSCFQDMKPTYNTLPPPVSDCLPAMYIHSGVLTE